MRHERIKTTLLAVVVGSLLLVTASAAGATGATQPEQTDEQRSIQTANTTAEDVVDSYQAAFTSADTVAFSFVTETDTGEATRTTNTSVWIDYENKRIRTERNSEYSETVRVVNESGTVVYDVGGNSLSESDQTFDANQTSVRELAQLLNESEVTLDGRESVDGAEAYRLDIAPGNETTYSSVDTMTVWLNTSSYAPEKFRMSAQYGETTYETTATFQNVRVNESFSDERFTIDAPDNATEEDDSAFDYTSYESLEDMRSNTSSQVTEAEVPENYTFDTGHVSQSDDYSSIGVRYKTPTNESLSIIETDSYSYNYSQSDRYESVGIGNQTGWYAEFEYDNTTTAILTWSCGERRFMIYGAVGQSTSTDIAESMACE